MTIEGKRNLKQARWFPMWRLGWPFGGPQLALHLVYTVYTKLLHTNRGLGGLLETPSKSPKECPNTRNCKRKKKLALSYSIITNLTKQLRSLNLSSMLVCFLKWFTKFGEALVASNQMVLLGWLTSKTQKHSFKQRTNFLFKSLL